MDRKFKLLMAWSFSGNISCRLCGEHIIHCPRQHREFFLYIVLNDYNGDSCLFSSDTGLCGYTVN